MKYLPTDLEILDKIYELYFDEFVGFDAHPDSRINRTLLPIDIDKVALALKTDKDIVFGRLYFHLQHKFGYVREDKTRVGLFILSIESNVKHKREIHLVNFPYMASVLADLRREHQNQTRTYQVAFLSFVISVVSAVVAILALVK